MLRWNHGSIKKNQSKNICFRYFIIKNQKIFMCVLFFIHDKAVPGNNIRGY